MVIRMKKYVSVIIAIALILSAFVFSIPEAYASTGKTGTINTQDANLREEPSTASNVITKMNQGDKVTVLDDETGGWYKIKDQDKTGYVRADFIDVMVTGLDDSAVIMIDTPMTQQPDTAGTVAANLTANTQITVTGEYGGLYQIRTGSQTGYVLKTSVHKYRIISIGLRATLNASGVNLRSTPSATGESLCILKKGTSVTIDSITDVWAKLSYSGKTGYVKGSFITYNVSDRITTMSSGMRAQAVTTVQLALKKRGLFYPAANGVYGNATKTAVAKFQDSVGLPSDGIAGPQTLLLLLGSEGANSLWNNYRTEIPAEKPQKSGRVILEDWFDGMDKIMKKYTTFEVIDVRTGVHWQMERFGDVTAHNHADVCPMTKSDTAAMTKAWGGKLNDSRRPVWVKYEGKYYAAGLMGYVHNTSPIKDNGMDGQVCLHFRGSKLHVAPAFHIDEAQQACIWEAFAKASKLDDYIAAGKV